MGAVNDVVNRLRTAFRADKERGGDLLAKGATSPVYPDSGYDLLQAYGYDALSDYLRLEQDLLSRFVDYESMDDYPEIAAALDIYADDSSQPDTAIKRTVWVTSPDKTIQHNLDDMFHKQLRMDEETWEIARSCVKYGNDYEEMLINENGVVGLNFLPAPTIRRVEGPRGELYGFVQDFKGRFGYCLARGSRVWGTQGLEEIQDFSAKTLLGHSGGTLRAFPLKERHASGTKRVFRVSTRHREVFLTEDHPVLVERAGGGQEWVKVKDLKLVRYAGKKRNIDYSRSDKLVICTRMAAGEVPEWSALWKFDPFDTKWGGKGTPKQIQLPERITPEFCRLFGFLLGDGWTEGTADAGTSADAYEHTNHKGDGNVRVSGDGGRVSFARSEYEYLNARYDALLTAFGLVVSVGNSGTQSSVNSIQLVRVLHALGWKNGAENKRVPGWVCGLPETHREAFLSGFLDADGWDTKTKAGTAGQHTEIANYDLARDIKNLADGLGYRTGRIGTRVRKPGTVITSSRTGRSATVQSQLPCFNLHISSTKFEAPFVAENVIGIEYYEDSEVFDLEVDDSAHNFIADGVVVHNSPTEFQAILSRRADAIRSMASSSVGGTQGNLDKASALEPWEVVHFRLRGKQRRNVYGYSVLESSRWIWKRLLLLEDAAMIHRLQRAPERFAFYVDVGDLPPAEALAFVNKVRQQHKKKKFVNPSTNAMDMKFDPVSQDEDFYVPVRKGVEGTRIEVLGGPSWQSMEDVSYFQNKLFASMKVPKAYLAQDESAARAVLSSEDVRFARSVLRVQRELRNGFKKVGRTHLAALNIDPNKVEFEMNMTVPSAIFELAQLEVRNSRADLAARMREHVSLHWVLRNVYQLNDDDIEKIIEERGEDVRREGKVSAEVERYSALAQKTEGGPPQGIKLLESKLNALPAGSRKRVTEKELFAGNRESEKRATEKLDKLLSQSRRTAQHVHEIGGLLRDVVSAGRK